MRRETACGTAQGTAPACRGCVWDRPGTGRRDRAWNRVQAVGSTRGADSVGARRATREWRWSACFLRPLCGAHASGLRGKAQFLRTFCVAESAGNACCCFKSCCVHLNARIASFLAQKLRLNRKRGGPADRTISRGLRMFGGLRVRIFLRKFLRVFCVAESAGNARFFGAFCCSKISALSGAQFLRYFLRLFWRRNCARIGSAVDQRIAPYQGVCGCLAGCGCAFFCANFCAFFCVAESAGNARFFALFAVPKFLR